MIRLFLKALLLCIAFMVVVFVWPWLSCQPEYSVLTEVGQAKQAARQAEEVEYQEWAKREDDARRRERKEERFRQRYESEK